jgi:hypothetical protein
MPFDQLPNGKQAMIVPATATATTMAESTPRPAIKTRCYLRQVICQCTHHVGDRIGSDQCQRFLAARYRYAFG